ncbi:hypothetical protein BDQ17DRAFT_1435255 [Cyathus striatus]|nr:hypothetical protein BDQ17DRAFT_1435255 [Cyathus striatus]
MYEKVHKYKPLLSPLTRFIANNPNNACCIEGTPKFDLELPVKDQLGYGRCGTVFEATQELLWEHTNPEAKPMRSPGPEYLPPLVLKVTDESTYLDLGREVINYRELRSFEGISVPRFYGWFNRILSVLVIERMGEHLTMKESENEIEDIRDMLRDLARKRMVHHDICYNNILQALTSPPGYLGRVCYLHNRIHKYRIIDFEQGQKIENGKPPEISVYYVQQLADIYRDYN